MRWHPVEFVTRTVFSIPLSRVRIGSGEKAHDQPALDGSAAGGRGLAQRTALARGAAHSHGPLRIPSATVAPFARRWTDRPFAGRGVPLRPAAQLARPARRS